MPSSPSRHRSWHRLLRIGDCRLLVLVYAHEKGRSCSSRATAQSPQRKVLNFSGSFRRNPSQSFKLVQVGVQGPAHQFSLPRRECLHALPRLIESAARFRELREAHHQDHRHQRKNESGEGGNSEQALMLVPNLSNQEQHHERDRRRKGGVFSVDELDGLFVHAVYANTMRNLDFALLPEEPPVTTWRRADLAEEWQKLRAELPSPAVVAIDGRSASGKTTLAGKLPGAVVVGTDDLAWNEPLFEWSHLLREGILEPFYQGLPVDFTPPAWARHGRAGSIKVPAGTPLLVLEGVGSADADVDAVIWVQSDRDEAARRGIERDLASGENGNAEETQAFWDTWDEAERAHLAQDRPWERARLIVAGTAAETYVTDGPVRNIPWSNGKWTHPPAHVEESDGDLLVTAVEGSDAWRVTSYGFIHETEHALLAPFDGAVEVEFTAAFSQQFDQAGIFVRVSDERWIKAGVEFADGACQLGAVVTDGMSDWSLAPVPEWTGKRILIRISHSGDALILRARAEGEEFRLVRVIPFPPELVAEAGPFVNAPSRAGLTVPIHAWRCGAPDVSLH